MTEVENEAIMTIDPQFTPHSNLQLGLLWPARSAADFFRLQIFFTHNLDLH